MLADLAERSGGAARLSGPPRPSDQATSERNIADTSFDTGYNSFGYLLVTNKWGDETKIVFSCKSGHDGR